MIIDVLFVRRGRVDCVVDAFIALVICVEFVLFRSFVDIGFLMIGDKDGLPVLLPLLIMR